VQTPQANVCKGCKGSFRTWCHQALVISSSVAKNALSLSLDVKSDQQHETYEKNDVSNYMALLSRKSSNNVP
jgi:hypothetical protein